MSRRSGLGKGLGALIPNELVHDADALLRELPITAIEPNRFQPREHFDEEALSSLADSIRELGVLQPVLVRAVGEDRYELIAGERRWRAARRAGLGLIPALVRDATDTGSLEQALVENLHRADLNPLEEAGAYQQLVEDFELTQEQVAQRVGKSRSAVANTLRLLHLPAGVQRFVADGRLSAGHARVLLSSGDRAFQEQLGQRIVAEGLTVRQAEEAIRAHLAQLARASDPQVDEGDDAAGGPPAITEAPSAREASPGDGGARRTIASPTSVPPPAPPTPAGARPLPPAGLLELEQVLGEYFDTSVHVALGRGRGRLTIDFADVEDLERIYRLIVHE